MFITVPSTIYTGYWSLSWKRMINGKYFYSVILSTLKATLPEYYSQYTL